MSSFLQVLEENISSDKIISIAKTLNKIHNPYLMDFQIWQLLKKLLGEEYSFILNRYKNIESAHKVLNDIIIKYCPGERIIKYNLVKKYLNRVNEVTLFEMNVENSRVDLGRVNGHSTAYEIKTEFDSTVRLEKQVSDYSKVFEKIYIVTHPNHFEKIMEIVPEYCGVMVYRLNNGNCIFSTKRKALRSFKIDPLVQIKSLTSEEIGIILKYLKVQDIPTTREGRVHLLLKRCDERKINIMFKYAIKNRYKKQWEFLKDNFYSILPVDIQSFFHSQVDPNMLYTRTNYVKELQL